MVASERAEADLCYCGEPEVIDLPDEGSFEMILAKKRACMQYEMCNKCFKHWNYLSQNFRHGVTLHQNCLFAIAVLTQLLIEDGEPLFDATFVNFNI